MKVYPTIEGGIGKGTCSLASPNLFEFKPTASFQYDLLSSKKYELAPLRQVRHTHRCRLCGHAARTLPHSGRCRQHLSHLEVHPFDDIQAMYAGRRHLLARGCLPPQLFYFVWIKFG